MNRTWSKVVSGLIVSCGVLVVACSSAPQEGAGEEGSDLTTPGPIKGMCAFPPPLDTTVTGSPANVCPSSVSQAMFSFPNGCCESRVQGFVIVTSLPQCPVIDLPALHAKWIPNTNVNDVAVTPGTQPYNCAYSFASITPNAGVTVQMPSKIDASSLCAANPTAVGYILPVAPTGKVVGVCRDNEAHFGPGPSKPTGCEVCVKSGY